MSNFETWGVVTQGLMGSAPARFIASTTDAFATIIAAGYMNDKYKEIKANDKVEINYLDASTFPVNVGEAAIYGVFHVQYDPILNNWNLIPEVPAGNTIANYGLHSALYSNAGGSATTTFNDASINPNSVVIARWQSSANAVKVETVLPGNGTITVVSSADPGVSVLEYISILPSVPLQNAGVYAAKYTNAGGSATIVIANPNITAAMVVEANFASQANASIVQTVLAGAGTITIVASADPGASVIEYVAALPSSALTALGFYAAKYTNAGGSATTTITDANIVASSIVVADWASQANAAQIEKVTPAAGSLVILSSADPGASVLNYSATPVSEGSQAGNFLVSSNNLSDVASASASLANLGGLPLAGGQMTGSILLDRGTATSTAGAATVNHQAGVITTEALTTAAASAYAFTLTDSRITTASIVLLQLMGGTNTTRGLELRAIPGSGSATLSIYNNNVAGTALNGTLIFGFVVI
jgi:hypothetical protein